MVVGLQIPAAGQALMKFCPHVLDVSGGVFDPFGFSRGDEKLYKKYKQNEVRAST